MALRYISYISFLVYVRLVCGDWGPFDRPHGGARLVDAIGENLLMRIGWPIGPMAAARKSLEAELRFAAGSRFPKKPFELIDVSLLSDHSSIALEHSVFSEHFRSFPSFNYEHFDQLFAKACATRQSDRFEGCPTSMQPGLLGPRVRSRLAADFEQWEGDALEERVLALRALLEQRGPVARVIFFHCGCGCDRTGEMFAAYAMRYLNMSLTDAWVENVQVAGRSLVYSMQVASQWYCEYLAGRGLYSYDDCGTCVTPSAEYKAALKRCLGSDERDPSSPQCKPFADMDRRATAPRCYDLLAIANPGLSSSTTLPWAGESSVWWIAALCFVVVAIGVGRLSVGHRWHNDLGCMHLLTRNPHSPNRITLLTVDA